MATTNQEGLHKRLIKVVAVLMMVGDKLGDGMYVHTGYDKPS